MLPLDAFQAIADPTRRMMLERLRDGECTASKLCDGFEQTQPALSKHLRILREAGLVEVRVEGRFRYYRQRPEGMRTVADWIATHETFWAERLNALGDRLANRRSNP